MLRDLDELHKQLKQKNTFLVEQQATIEQYRRAETNWHIERQTLQHAEASIKNKLAQVEEDLGLQLQAQEKSIEHAQQALGATAASLNTRLHGLEKELAQSQSETLSE